MSDASTRKYCSPLRKRQADRTRKGIADAAERLLLKHGYARTTIDAIAREAGVCPQTVYAVYGSKRGIIAEILERTVLTDPFHDMYESILEATDLHEALRRNVDMLLKLRRAESAMYDLLTRAGILASDLAQVEQQLMEQRWPRLVEHVRMILGDVPLRDGMGLEKACDIFYGLISRGMYDALVQQRGWSDEAYRTWLYDSLIRSLLP